MSTEETKPVVILSYGMGVESHAILERWINEPECRPFADWSQLIVVTAQVGEEHLSDTVPNVERRTLPLLRRHQIRFVEVARRGAVEADGIVILQDTRNPERLHAEGVFKLSDELLSNGTVPQFGSTEHRCAMKFKAWVIESWMAFEFRGAAERPVYHVFGFNNGEESRIRTSEVHIERHNAERAAKVERAPLIVFGFNSEEVGRIERNRKYDGPLRRGCYPLLDWGWNRQKCWEYIFNLCGIDWKKSACSFCPFSSEAAKGEPCAVVRWNSAPEQTAHGLLVEFNALCFNPRGQLYKKSSMMAVVKKHNVVSVLDAFERRLAKSGWGFYRVRRIYTGIGQAIRCVERLAEGTRESMASRFEGEVSSNPQIEVDTMHGIRYAMTHRRQADIYPSAEGFFVIAPLFVETKVRGKIEKFEQRWNRVTRGLAMNGELLDPKQDEMILESASA